ncbi:MAG: ChaN family lipoprotein [Candidatus Aminicenantes bacterium]|nr:ChaN family lipoprotein [Candidatus Aminicenantes bacterium]
MKIKKIAAISILLFTFSMLFGQEEENKILILKIGNKRFKDKVMDVSSGKVYSAKEGKLIPFQKMIKEMKDSDFIYVGETHTSLSMHEVQFKIIQALYEQDRNVFVGLEMFPISFQDVLNKWSMAILSREKFIQESQWYVNWNYHFGFYEKIFEFVKDHKIPLSALNVPREIITKIRKKGWDALSEEEKKLIPQPDLSHEEHRAFIRTIFKSAGHPPQMKGKGMDMAFEGLYRAQSAWDEVMAFYALQSRKREDKKVIVLAGSGHLLYNLGINLRVYEKSHLPYKTVICVVIPDGKESVQVSRSLADYVWGIAEEKIPAFPHIGLQFKKFDRLDNLVIERMPIIGVATSANFKKGDVLLSVDGKNFSDINELRIYLSRFNWNDEVKFCLLRDAQEIEVLLKFQPPERDGS